MLCSVHGRDAGLAGPAAHSVILAPVERMYFSSQTRVENSEHAHVQALMFSVLSKFMCSTSFASQVMNPNSSE